MARKFLLILIIACLSPSIWAQKMIPAMTFHDESITNILLALADAVDVTIIPDETVHGQASFHFSNVSFEEGLKSFLDPHKMYYTEQDGIYYVSRIRVKLNEQTNKISVDAEDVLVRFLIDQISEAIGKAILYDPLPTISPTIHVVELAPKRILEILIRQAEGFELNDEGDYYYIKIDEEFAKKNALGDPTLGPIVPFNNLLKNANGTYSINKSRIQFKDLVQELFAKENFEYQLLYNRAQQINEPLFFRNKSFHQMLNLICEKGNADYAIRDGIYYIYEVQERDIIKKFKVTQIIGLKYITAQDLQRIMPSDIGAGSSKFYRMDMSSNTVILNGSMDEIDPLIEFIDKVDREDVKNKYYRYDLNFIEAQKIISMLPDKFKFIKTIVIPESNSFLIMITREKKAILDEYIALLDRPAGSHEVRLKYIKSEDLIKLLPPSAAKDDVVETLDPTLVFFKGNKEKLENFQKQLTIFDQPVPQIRYHVFVISHTEGDNLSWMDNDDDVMKLTLFDSGENTKFTFEDIVLGSLFNINFDVASFLGIAGSLSLSVMLNQNNARIVTDTTLHGLSGEEVNLDDTKKHYFQSSDVDSETSDDTGGTTKTIETGFKLKIEGWASGDGMITMDVDIELSDAGGGDELTSGSGTTTGQQITQKVRTMSGVPLEITGLQQQTDSLVMYKVPFLGNIPIIGEILFSTRDEKVNKSKLSIYILPQIEKTSAELADTERRIKDLYYKYIRN